MLIDNTHVNTSHTDHEKKKGVYTIKVYNI